MTLWAKNSCGQEGSLHKDLKFAWLFHDQLYGVKVQSLHDSTETSPSCHLCQRPNLSGSRSRRGL